MADYRCLNCDTEFDDCDADYIDEDRGECWGRIAYQRVRACPCCRNTEIEELKECPHCEKLILESEEMCGECEKIFAVAKDPEKCYKVAEAMEEATVEINNYLAYMFSSSEINEILLSTLLHPGCRSKIAEYSREYIESDFESFAEAYSDTEGGKR